MNDNITHQIGQVLIESHPTLGRAVEWIGGAVTLVLMWMGTIGGEFARIFDPHTWTMATIASLFSIPAAIMYFIAKYTEYKLLKRQRELIEVKPNADTCN